MIVILYTTKYRLGGDQFPVVAETLAEERRAAGYVDEVLSRAVESKEDVLRCFHEIVEKGQQIDEFHFVGHSGMYGPMFGTTAFPEQFSPFEWQEMKIPFAANASASFHCCRSARWFAPFFARTFNVTAKGYFWYTTFSRSLTHYVAAGKSTEKPLYTIGCKGRKSHGYLASIRKRIGAMPAEEIKTFAPQVVGREDTYDAVAELYDTAFQDIRVRKDEWNWLNQNLPSRPDLRVLDIGCGNGALLNALSDRIAEGVGIDESEAMLKMARQKNKELTKLSFEKINGPKLPFADASFDAVVSLMSFRYLDWDPLLAEIKRIAKPDAPLLIVDMVTVPVTGKEFPKFIVDKLRTLRDQRMNSSFDSALAKLVSHPDWKKMLEYNPIRSQHEMKWYLESRFPGRKMELLNIAWHSRIVAFNTGPMSNCVEAKLTYP